MQVQRVPIIESVFQRHGRRLGKFRRCKAFSERRRCVDADTDHYKQDGNRLRETQMLVNKFHEGQIVLPKISIDFQRNRYGYEDVELSRGVIDVDTKMWIVSHNGNQALKNVGLDFPDTQLKEDTDTGLYVAMIRAGDVQA